MAGVWAAQRNLYAAGKKRILPLTEFSLNCLKNLITVKINI